MKEIRARRAMREGVVWALMESGASNTAIAKQLGVSPGRIGQILASAQRRFEREQELWASNGGRRVPTLGVRAANMLCNAGVPGEQTPGQIRAWIEKVGGESGVLKYRNVGKVTVAEIFEYAGLPLPVHQPRPVRQGQCEHPAEDRRPVDFSELVWCSRCGALGGRFDDSQTWDFPHGGAS